MLFQMKFGREYNEEQISMCSGVMQAFFKGFLKNDGCVSKSSFLVVSSVLEFLRILRELGQERMALT